MSWPVLFLFQPHILLGLWSPSVEWPQGIPLCPSAPIPTPPLQPDTMRGILPAFLAPPGPGLSCQHDRPPSLMFIQENALPPAAPGTWWPPLTWEALFPLLKFSPCRLLSIHKSLICLQLHMILLRFFFLTWDACCNDLMYVCSVKWQPVKVISKSTPSQSPLWPWSL